MNLDIFLEMLNDKNFCNLEKLKYKYGASVLKEYVSTLEKSVYAPLSIKDNKNKPLYFIPSKIQITSQKLKTFLQKTGGKIGFSPMEDEIIATLSIENINSSRESVREILKGYAPKTDDEKKVFGIKQGLDFISDISNKINEENLYKLYMLSCGQYVDDNNKLIANNKYRHDKVYVVGKKVDADILHEGADFKILSEKMNELINFINNDNEIDDITKSIIAHYYFAYLHPYFDGNGRTARLLQMWILVQKGYSSTLYIPLSKYINEQKNLYYKTFELITNNYKLSGVLDVTPFIIYFIDNIINKFSTELNNDIITQFEEIIKTGDITPKERDLFYFVLSNYGKNEFSTKDLEKDYRNVAYATVRSFCLKLEEKEILSCTKFSNRTKYKLNI